ncbi:glycerophosphodiester phosphodiesterase [Consotaella aegiceratis]|uniref:glycerophosphodiester phosphodiesterase n=1 Tax=Consotaella aegiceratis TaxID=3097961 RepID=UPI002F3F7765
MTSAIFCEIAGHRTWLKWHRGRRCACDTAFTSERLLEGMNAGASIEVDLRKHAGGGFAVLHDAVLGREATGEGRVCDLDANALRALFRRDNDGRPTRSPVLVLADLPTVFENEDIPESSLLQLDLKEDRAAIEPADVAAFAAAVTPLKRNAILSGGDAEAVACLAAAVPGLRIGHDPCHEERLVDMARTRRYDDFVAAALAEAPDAAMIYLHYRLVLDAMDAGHDLIAAFQAARKRVDAYTIASTSPESLATVRRLLALKVDQITTDDPEALGAAIAAMELA